ncbi:DUF4127 family protein [Microbacterium sp.]|uniref:DUF4127 family protein n=2 Tax=Micrococcales TaxID=85006 RepID=UPI001AD0F806|nr:DUF4127 family protein [Microbacterium sp.]MBN9192163.1 DUF4127 family protein [Microbacterium sp.]
MNVRTIALVPLDERPVNVSLPREVARIGGAELLLPPAAALPRMRDGGDPEAIRRWLLDVAADADAVIVSADTLGYGGLIPSRTNDDSLAEILGRLETVRRMSESRPDRPIRVMSTVMRASDSYSSSEEPEYWSDHGRELHRLGAQEHEMFLRERSRLDAAATVPVDVLRDFHERRLRNHIVNLSLVHGAARGAFRELFLTADDTAARAAGTLEQLWIDRWAEAPGIGGATHSYPGADEVGAVLVARTLSADAATPVRLSPAFASPGAAERIAPFENVPARITVERQIRAAGATSSAGADPDVVLIVHGPSGGAADEARTAAAVLVERALEEGRAVALADVWEPNGSDTALTDLLAGRGLLGELLAYGGWNTAGNTIGGVVATAVASVLSARAGVDTAALRERQLWHRIIEDDFYQSRVRTELGGIGEYREHFSLPFTDDVVAHRYRGAVAERLVAAAAEMSGSRWEPFAFDFPWNRTFEIDFELRNVT